MGRDLRQQDDRSDLLTLLSMQQPGNPSSSTINLFGGDLASWIVIELLMLCFELLASSIRPPGWSLYRRCTECSEAGVDKHPIALRPYHAYSPASVAKSYLEAMGIKRPGEKFKISNRKLGVAMQTYYGGRSTRIRRADVPLFPLISPVNIRLAVHC